MAAHTFSVGGRKIQRSFIRDDVKWKKRVCFIVIESPFCLSSIQINILLGCNSQTSLFSTTDIFHLIVQPEHRHGIHNTVLDKIIRQRSPRPHFRIPFYQPFSLILYFGQFLILELQLDTTTKSIYPLHFICSLATAVSTTITCVRGGKLRNIYCGASCGVFPAIDNFK